jgi:hypothetical protein
MCGYIVGNHPPGNKGRFKVCRGRYNNPALHAALHAALTGAAAHIL